MAEVDSAVSRELDLAAEEQNEGTEDEAPLPVFENYDVFERIATGGMGSIFTAKRHGTTKLCVIKTLHAHYVDNEVVSKRFLREAQVAALFDHPNISRLTDAKIAGDELFLAMDFIAGQDLEALMFKLMGERRMLPAALSLTVAAQVLEGLHYAHEFETDDEHLHIVHRDLSPRNIMLTFEGDVQIIDFGLARAKVGEFRTAANMVMGTLRYMSPEQALGERVDRRSDIYTLGTVLYENLTGRAFIRGEKHSDILPEILERRPASLEDCGIDLPAALNDVVQRAMDKDPKLRFQTAAEFRDALVAAAGPLSATPRDQIGDFVRLHFPKEHEAAQQRMAMVEGNAALTTLPRDAPELIATRIGPAPAPGEDVPVRPVLSAPVTDDHDLAPRHWAQTQTVRLGEAPPLVDSSPAVTFVPKRRSGTRPSTIVAAIAASLAAVAIVYLVSRAPPSRATPESNPTELATDTTEAAVRPTVDVVPAKVEPTPVETAERPPRPDARRSAKRSGPKRSETSTPEGPSKTKAPKRDSAEQAAPTPKRTSKGWQRSILAAIEEAKPSVEPDETTRTEKANRALAMIVATARDHFGREDARAKEIAICSQDSALFDVTAKSAEDCFAMLRKFYEESKR